MIDGNEHFTHFFACSFDNCGGTDPSLSFLSCRRETSDTAASITLMQASLLKTRDCTCCSRQKTFDVSSNLSLSSLIPFKMLCTTSRPLGTSDWSSSIRSGPNDDLGPSMSESPEDTDIERDTSRVSASWPILQ